jgi:hypothetical protein
MRPCPAAIHYRDPHLDHLNRGQFLQHCRCCQTRRVNQQPVLQCHLQAVSQKRDRHVRVSAVLELMIDRPYHQLAFQGAEHTLDLRQLHVARPQYRGVFASEMAAQQIVTVAFLRRLQFCRKCCIFESASLTGWLCIRKSGKVHSRAANSENAIGFSHLQERST